jgi:hypothetical protein
MTKDQVKAIRDRVRTWPPERQEDMIEILKAAEEQEARELRLSGEQLAEVRRRRARRDPNRVPFDGVFRQFRLRGT